MFVFTVIAVRLLQPPNAATPMLVTLPGIVTLIRPESLNALFPRLATLVPIVTLVRLAQPANAQSPTTVMLVGIVTLARLVQESNAPSPMKMTGRAWIIPGMVTTGFVPV